MEINKEHKSLNDTIRKCINSHDQNRIYVQRKLEKIWAQTTKEIDKLEDSIETELEKAFETEDIKEQEFIQNTSNILLGENQNDSEREAAKAAALSEIKKPERGYKVERRKRVKEVKSCLYVCSTHELCRGNGNVEGDEDIIFELRERARRHYERKLAAMEDLRTYKQKLFEELEECKTEINTTLEEAYKREEERLQQLLVGTGDEDEKQGGLVAE